MAAPEMRFVDPFNGLSSVDPVIRRPERMFDDAAEVSFRLLDQACTGERCFLRWIGRRLQVPPSPAVSEQSDRR